MRRPTSTPVVLALLAALALGAGACSSSTTTAGPGTTAGPTTEATTGGTAVGTANTTPDGRCVSRMPGEILTAEQAVVIFSPSQICPGYVTIAPGTPVTWVNLDTKAHTLDITEGNLPGGKAVANTTIEAGQSFVRPFNTLGTFMFVTDAIPSFRGTVEVTDGSGTMAH